MSPAEEQLSRKFSLGCPRLTVTTLDISSIITM
jgi:hypothetical protein